ncbi:MAG: adenosylhomocysteinase [Candidatus Omnitrophica bacterium]|nr:adenosylhomocysteinase [Candidatus Omnitrophota bacterium]
MTYDIKDIKLADKGRLRIEWAADNMPVMAEIGQRFQKEKPLKGIKLACCLHVTTETAVLMYVLKAGGASLVLCASNPLSTQDDVAASLVKHLKIPVFAIKGEKDSTYYQHLKSVLAIKPDITMDDGADLVSAVHRSPKPEARSPIMGGTEETTTGVIRLRALEKEGKLRYPLIAVNDADTKHLFDNRYGTGQSTIDGILRATNKLLAGSIFVVCGYGFCGRGVARRAQGMGANVIICETNPLSALEAAMDGLRVLPLSEAAKIGDIFVTVTGDISVLRKEHFLKMKDGAILANAGHFNVEIDVDSLKRLSKRQRTIREYVEQYTLRDGKRIYLLGEGRLINLAAAEGHPAQVMDMSFANQALCAEYIKNNYQRLENKVYNVPRKIDNLIARLKLESLGIKIDSLTKKQISYLESWQSGT